MKVSIDKEKCIGCGSCEALCPDIFGMKDNKAFVKIKEAKGKQEKCAKEASDSCPTQAIIIK